MMPAFRFNARPISGGFALTTDLGVTMGYVTGVSKDKDMLTKFYVTTVGTCTRPLGECKNTAPRTH